MQCTQCGQINQSAKFCVKCGANLQAAATSEGANIGFQPPVQPLPAAQPQPQPQQTSYQQSRPNLQKPVAHAHPNPQLQQAKQVGKQYLDYFLEVLKSPVRKGQNSTDADMVNGLITLILFSLVLPLIAYIKARATFRRFDFGGFGFADSVSFSGVVIKPFFFLIIIVLLVNSVMFLVLKLGNVNLSYREVTARFGSFMIPSVASFAVALLFSLISSGSVIMGLLIGIGLFSWFVAVCFVIYSFKRDQTSGLDAFYGVILTYIACAILIALLGADLAHTLFRGLDSPLNF
ncbi:zinc ribbon domain-containing protein [Cohnella endophytica]|uniref:zinc ribbon domain-containing protein n=1 Tax=Cohnella endophytica TaxID=2419778 RepID=UPI0011C385A4|nr:zinc ribbon domain-containing protein [Cohnella endophytica]